GKEPWELLADQEEWELAEWLMKNLGQGHTNKFMNLLITKNRSHLLFHNTQSSLQQVDSLLSGPGWTCEKVSVMGNLQDDNDQIRSEEYKLWMRNLVEITKDLIGNPLFKDSTVYAPERAYADKSAQERIFDDMWTADWCWEKQVSCHMVQYLENNT
ncbi:hypothetical protein SERLA73DRAFT_55114, partial [Serpula lacrymans var. lacrymans S7.3]